MKKPNDVKRKNPSTPSLGRTYRNRGVMVHVSKRFIRNPQAIQAELDNKPFDGPEFLPLHGETYNVGRNAAKREKKAKRFA